MTSGFAAGARRAWAHWLGDGEAVRAVQGGHPLPGRLDTAIETELPRVAACLYAPPHEDVRPSGGWARTPQIDARFAALARRYGLAPEPFWPEGRPYAVVVTHDVDRVRCTYQGGLEALRRGRVVEAVGRFVGDGLARAGADVYDNFTTLSAWERNEGFRSAWFFLNEHRRWGELLRGRPQHAVGVYRLADRSKAMRRLVAAGHEVGVHYNLDSGWDSEAIRRDCAVFRSLGVREPLGGRAHYLRFTAATREGVRAAGLRYDASMGFNYTNGFRCGTAFPFLLPTADGSFFWELPTCLMDTALRSEAATWDERTDIASRLLDACRVSGGVFAVNWHQRFANPHREPRWWALMTGVVARARADGAWFATPARLVEWWAHGRFGGSHG